MISQRKIKIVKTNVQFNIIAVECFNTSLAISNDLKTDIQYVEYRSLNMNNLKFGIHRYASDSF